MVKKETVSALIVMFANGELWGYNFRVSLCGWHTLIPFVEFNSITTRCGPAWQYNGLCIATGRPP